MIIKSKAVYLDNVNLELLNILAVFKEKRLAYHLLF